MNFIEDIKRSIQSSSNIINIITTEEERLVRDIIEVARSLKPLREIRTWDCVVGMDVDEEKGDYKSCLDMIRKSSRAKPTLFVLKDFYRYLDYAVVIRQLKSLVPILEVQKKTIIIISPEIKIPIELEEDIKIVEYPLPGYKDIEVMLKGYDRDLNLSSTEKDLFVRTAQGLSMKKIHTALNKAIVQYEEISMEAIEILIDEKKQFLKTNDILDLCVESNNIEDVGGLEQFKQWLKVRNKCFSLEAKAYGLPAPRGILLMGVQGTGKSLCAKVIARYWKIPLLRLDVGKLMGSYIGESECRTRQMIKIAEAMSPCALWIDEIDKAFMGIQKNVDSGAMARVFGALITWMQEKSKPVFIVATANDVSKLPPELLRKGRFDEVFFVDLPAKGEREIIFSVHLKKKRKEGLERFKVEELAEITEGYSGAEIEQIITDAMYEAFNEMREFDHQDIIKSIKRTIPLAKTSRSTIEELRRWVKEGRARNASSTQDTKN